MAKYKIRVEALDGNEELNQKYVDGIECDGFVIVGDKGEGCTVCIHAMSVYMISNAIAHNDDLMASGILAKAKREISEINKRKEIGNVFEALLGGIR